MRERDQILSLWERVAAEDQPAVLATVMKTEGSSYRMPGARLLLTQDGQHVGGISGGCLEDDIVKKAWWLTANGPVLRRYDTTPDGELSNDGYGLGCNGIIHVLLERVTRSAPSALPVLLAVRNVRRPALIAHVLAPTEAVGQRLIMAPGGSVEHNLSHPALVKALSSEIDKPEGGSRLFSPVPGWELLLERIDPPVQLLIFGAGEDAIPVSQFAKHLGWKVKVYDGRAHYAKPEKFPRADSVELRVLGSPAPVIDEWTAAITMTHSFSQDADVLRSLADRPVRYLGVLGPRKRTGQLLAETALANFELLPALHAPMGLDIGADGPEQVALAIVAEIQSVMNGRPAGLLRDRLGPIHSEATLDEGSPGRAWVRSIVCA